VIVRDSWFASVHGGSTDARSVSQVSTAPAWAPFHPRSVTATASACSVQPALASARALVRSVAVLSCARSRSGSRSRITGASEVGDGADGIAGDGQALAGCVGSEPVQFGGDGGHVLSGRVFRPLGDLSEDLQGQVVAQLGLVQAFGDRLDGAAPYVLSRLRLLLGDVLVQQLGVGLAGDGLLVAMLTSPKLRLLGRRFVLLTWGFRFVMWGGVLSTGGPVWSGQGVQAAHRDLQATITANRPTRGE